MIHTLELILHETEEGCSSCGTKPPFIIPSPFTSLCFLDDIALCFEYTNLILDIPYFHARCDRGIIPLDDTFTDASRETEIASCP